MAKYYTYDLHNKTNNATFYDPADTDDLEIHDLIKDYCLSMRHDPANVTTHGGGIALCSLDPTIAHPNFTLYVDQAQGKIDFDALNPTPPNPWDE